MKDYRKRATRLFDGAKELIEQDCDLMHANHSAAGRLRSGATAIAAIEIYQHRMSESLKQLLDEIAKVIDHRGREWRRAMSDIRAVLIAEAEKAENGLEPSFKLACADKGGARKAISERLIKAAKELELQLKSFEEGWTSPPAERWTSRHPAVYAVLLLICGSLLGAVVSHFWPKVEPPKVQAK